MHGRRTLYAADGVFRFAVAVEAKKNFHSDHAYSVDVTTTAPPRKRQHGKPRELTFPCHKQSVRPLATGVRTRGRHVGRLVRVDKHAAARRV